MILPGAAHFVLIGIVIGLVIAIPATAYFCTRARSTRTAAQWTRQEGHQWRRK